MWKNFVVFASAFGLGCFVFGLGTTEPRPLLSTPPVQIDQPIQNTEISSGDKPQSEIGYWILYFETKEDADSFFIKFRNALIENDKETVASMTYFPVRVGNTRKGWVATKGEFLKKFDAIFYPEFKNRITSATVDDLWGIGYKGITIKGGEIWISCYFKNEREEKVGKCKSKIVTINN